MTIWKCKIGIRENVKLNAGVDLPMRKAIEKMFEKITGKDCDFNFSGWGAELTSIQKEAIDE